MHILIVTASLPYPLASGGAIRVFGMLKGLHDAGHKLTLMSFSDKQSEATPLNDVCESIIILPYPQRSLTDRLQTLFFTSQPDIQTRFYSPVFEKELLALISENEFDLVQFEAIESACYLPAVREHFPEQAICFDTFNAEADLQRVIFEIDRQTPSRFPQAVYSWIQSKRIAQYEGDLCRAADLVIAVSEEDHTLLSAYREDDCTRIVPSGITVADYTTTDETISLPKNSIIFTGKMDYRPNVDAMLWFTDEILPQLPDTHLTIVGQKPHPRIQHLPEQANITLTGWVDSVLPYLHATDVYIAPLRMGSGTRLKILEAMAAGCAIVCTETAAAGLSDRLKSALVITDTPDTFADAIQQLLHDKTKRRAMSKQAQKSVAEQYDWSVLSPRLLNAYKEIGLG
ncbi:MAG: glycosyltransferase [Chloroflexota bacterium]